VHRFNTSTQVLHWPPFLVSMSLFMTGISFAYVYKYNCKNVYYLNRLSYAYLHFMRGLMFSLRPETFAFNQAPTLIWVHCKIIKCTHITSLSFMKITIYYNLPTSVFIISMFVIHTLATKLQITHKKNLTMHDRPIITLFTLNQLLLITKQHDITITF
jgi:uncharacterized membrane protein